MYSPVTGLDRTTHIATPELEVLQSTIIQANHAKEPHLFSYLLLLKIRDVTRTLFGGGGIFVYSCSAQRVSFQIKFKFLNLKRNPSGKT